MSSLNDSLAATLSPTSTTKQSAPGSAAIVDVRWRSPALLALFALFSLYYLWTAQPYLTGPAPQHHLYNLLTDGFLAGQVSLLQEPPKGLENLQNPYDPAQNWPYHQLHDVVYYKGKYYVYHGPAPALTLFAAVRLFVRERACPTTRAALCLQAWRSWPAVFS